VTSFLLPAKGLMSVSEGGWAFLFPNGFDHQRVDAGGGEPPLDLSVA